MSITTQKSVVYFEDMTDQEIIQHCKNICKKHGSKDGAINEIKAWSGTTPAIIFNHLESNKKCFYLWE